MDAPEPPAPGYDGVKPMPANLLYLWEKLPGAIWNDPQQRLMEARALRFVDSLHRPEPGEYEKNWPFAVPPKPYQLRIFAAARRLPFFALAPVAAGAGKTKMLADIAADKYMRGDIDCVAVVASPKGVHRQWIEKALPEHMTKEVRWVGAWWKSTRRVDPRVMRADKTRLRWLTFNIEAFSSGHKAERVLEEFMKSGRCMLVEDESSRIANPNANCTRAFIGDDRRNRKRPGLARLAVSRAILTGTPITKGIENLWAQYEFVDPRIIGMSNYYAFRARYCVLRPAFRGAGLGQVTIIGYRNVEEFVRKIAPVTFVVPKSVLELPEPIREEIAVELTEEQRRVYVATRRQLVDDLREMKVVSPVNAAVRFLRLQQVLCGRVYEPSAIEDEPPVLRRIPSNRVTTLQEYVEANLQGEPLVVWCRFRNDITEIDVAMRKIGRRPVTYYGDTSDDERAQAIADMKSGRADVFISNPQVGGMGVDGLQHVCQHAIYYSSSFNREHRWQSEARIWRLGMKGFAWFGDMVAPNTVDRMILDSYKETEELIATLLKRPEMIPVLNEE